MQRKCVTYWKEKRTKLCLVKCWISEKVNVRLLNNKESQSKETRAKQPDSQICCGLSYLPETLSSLQVIVCASPCETFKTLKCAVHVDATKYFCMPADNFTAPSFNKTEIL